MANRIRGITVEIGGDTTKLSKALKNVDSSIKNTQTQLRDVNKLLKLDPGNTELLSQKHKLLAQAVGDTKQRRQSRLMRHCQKAKYRSHSTMHFKERLWKRSRN